MELIEGVIYDRPREPLDAAYLSRAILRAGGTVSPLARPEIRVMVGDLLP